MRGLPILVLILTGGCVADRRGDQNTCPVHESALQEDTVRILYGLVLRDPDYWAAMKARFPLSNREYLGGCMIGCCSASSAQVRFCARCRQAEAEWWAQYPEALKR